jgi:prephenate dehydrogenase
MTQPLFRNALVLGTGLIGTSFALALVKHGVATLVGGYDPNPDAREAALRCGAFAFIEDDLERALGTGELIVLAAPPRAVRELLPVVAARCHAGRLVIDLASTKRTIVELAERVFENTASSFVGGHPMAGAPTGGAHAARADLFEGAPFALCPSKVTTESALDRAQELVRRLGSRPVVVWPRAHDAAVARISHLPHLAAAAVAIAAGETPDPVTASELAASGFRSTTRVAAGGRALWTEVLLDNKEEALACIDALKAALTSLEEGLRASDEEALGGVLEYARELRAKLLREVPGAPAPRPVTSPDEESGVRP